MIIYGAYINFEPDGIRAGESVKILKCRELRIAQHIYVPYQREVVHGVAKFPAVL